MLRCGRHTTRSRKNWVVEHPLHDNQMIHMAMGIADMEAALEDMAAGDTDGVADLAVEVDTDDDGKMKRVIIICGWASAF